MQLLGSEVCCLNNTEVISVYFVINHFLYETF